MRKAVRAIVLHEGKLLVMHRNKFGKEYYTLTGGSLEVGETLEEALFREIDEETTITIANPRLVFIEEAGDPYGTQYIYLCDYVSGEPKLRADSEEAQINKLGQNLHKPIWLGLSDVEDSPFVSEKLKTAVLNSVRDGFPDNTVEIR